MIRKQYTFTLIDECAKCKYYLQSRDKKPCIFCERNQDMLDAFTDNFEQGEPEVPAAPDVIAEEPHPNDKFLKQWGIKPEAMQELKKIKRRKF